MAPTRRNIPSTSASINYRQIIQQYPWIVAKEQFAILSPDSDGFLSALFLCHYLEWKVVGFYDGKILSLKKGVRTKDCVFLDGEIFRREIRSIGQHMLLYNKNSPPPQWNVWQNCIQPNNLRQYDVAHDFPSKYPFATIHFLLGIVGAQISFTIPDTAFAPLFFTDGAWQNLLRYPENCLNWLSYLDAGNSHSPLYGIFHGRTHSLHESMVLMYDFYRQRDTISITNERGDRLRISTTQGQPFNFVMQDGSYLIKSDPRTRAERFISLIGQLTGWIYKPGFWTCWEDLQIYRFTKQINAALNGSGFAKILAQQPLSFAVTARNEIQYTLESPDHLP